MHVNKTSPLLRHSRSGIPFTPPPPSRILNLPEPFLVPCYLHLFCLVPVASWVFVGILDRDHSSRQTEQKPLDTREAHSPQLPARWPAKVL
ncbi:hypothetical protein E2C01_066793 [Portunus trituberculatus]|uniref:Uncharacterized protein n=1 Tax=Portunus trituberculatus TaxID=210409 RepID=A0A5B7HVM3_PORTR|nr:hypothetical protein [Portunus trituberculatus]